MTFMVPIVSNRRCRASHCPVAGRQHEARSGTIRSGGDHIMQPSRTITLPDDLFESLARIAEQSNQTPEEVAIDMLIGGIRRYDEDPLLQLLGCIESDLTDVAEHHGKYIGQ